MAKLMRDAMAINQVVRALTIEINDIFQLWIPTTFIAFKYDLTWRCVGTNSKLIMSKIIQIGNKYFWVSTSPREHITWLDYGPIS
jgi:hypothetical protein